MDVAVFSLALHLVLFTLGSLNHVACSGGGFAQMSTCCNYRDVEKVLFEFEIQYRFQRTLILDYNSTTGNWTGFTEAGLVWADGRNKDPDDALRRKLEQRVLCTENMRIFQDLKSLTTAPRLRLTSVKDSSGTEPAVLVCSAYNFYPQNIELSWLLNGQKVTSEVTSTDVLTSDNFYYQLHSYLVYRAQPGGQVSCIVEHQALPEPLLQVWDPHPPVPRLDKVKIAVGMIFLVVGLTTLAVGFVKHKKCSAAACSVLRGCAQAVDEDVQETEAL